MARDTKKLDKTRDHRGLTESQEAFCINYVYYTGLKAHEALNLAGYNYTGRRNEDKAIHELFKNPKIKKRINELLEERNNEILVDKLWVIKNLKEMAEKSQSEMAKIKAVELLGKTMSMFSETYIHESREDPGKVIREARRKRQEKLDMEKHDNVVKFPTKDEGVGDAENQADENEG